MKPIKSFSIGWVLVCPFEIYFTLSVNFFPFLIIDYLVGLLIGDVFSSFSIGKGGDFGIVETLYILGLPLSLIIFIVLIRLIFSLIKKINSNEIEEMEKISMVCC